MLDPGYDPQITALPYACPRCGDVGETDNAWHIAGGYSWTCDFCGYGEDVTDRGETTRPHAPAGTLDTLAVYADLVGLLPIGADTDGAPF